MKYTYIYAVALSFLSVNAMAQETYENTKIMQNDLNGTARYVGMGGAMESLGADLSTISTNPAGLSLYRRSVVATSLGVRSQTNNHTQNGNSNTRFAFDQIGGTYVWRSSNISRIGVAFNYRNRSDLNSLFFVAGSLGDGTQNKLSYMKAIGGTNDKGVSDFNLEKRKEGIMGTAPYTNQLDNLYYNNLIVDKTNTLGYNQGTSYNMSKTNSGHVGEYSFNISGTSNERFYWGLTFGFYDVNYTENSVYTERLIDKNNAFTGETIVTDRRVITGTGFNVVAGAIIRPFATSPFRFGLSIATPTWYDLTTSNATTLAHTIIADNIQKTNYSNESYSYKVFTPWVFGLSAGHTFGNKLALGASYEYADYGTTDTRVNDAGGYYDSYTGTYETTSSSDKAMNAHTQQSLKGVSTLKLGAELKLNNHLAVRTGYNYVSPMFKKGAYKDGIIESYGSVYSSATDYTNWESTNRFTLGLGYVGKKVNVDLAYVHSVTNGTFYPFMGGSVTEYKGKDDKGTQIKEDLVMTPMGVKVSNNTNKVLLTLTYRF